MKIVSQTKLRWYSHEGLDAMAFEKKGATELTDACLTLKEERLKPSIEKTVSENA